MIKVELPLESCNILQREKEVKAWCRETFGRNKRGEPRQWRGTLESTVIEDDDDAFGWVHVYYLVFFFRTQIQVSWFLLRWR